MDLSERIQDLVQRSGLQFGVCMSCNKVALVDKRSLCCGDAPVVPDRPKDPGWESTDKQARICIQKFLDISSYEVPDMSWPDFDDLSMEEREDKAALDEADAGDYFP
jgi:hypothetical protein